MTLTYRHTRAACSLGSICQACNNNLPPLLFIIFQSSYGISYEKLGRLILINFLTQLIVDALAVRFVDRIGYRVPIVAAQICSAAGLAVLACAPYLPIPVYGTLTIGIIISAIGGGLLEVLASPIADALPAEENRKAANMALLHSFYCWGQVGVVLITTLLLSVIGSEHWQILPVIWMILPLINTYLFIRVPLVTHVEPGKQMGLKKLFRAPIFWAAMILMLCAGAAELTISQWSSLFAEQGLGLSKVWGDLAGPCLFAILMGLGRVAYGLWGEKIRLVPVIAVSAILCVAAYLITPLAPSPILSLAGCALCGFAVSVMWPGTISLSAARFPLGGTAMFGILAMCGDMGCSAGPWLAGLIAENASSTGIGAVLFPAGSEGLRMGILSGIIFPVIMLCALFLFREKTSVTLDPTAPRHS